MKSRKHLSRTQRLYLLAVDTNAKAFARLDREEKTGERTPRTTRLFYWDNYLHAALMDRLSAYDAQAAEYDLLTWAKNEAIRARDEARFQTEVVRHNLGVVDRELARAQATIDAQAARIAELEAQP